MLLKEIELDLPYMEDKVFVEKIKQSEEVTVQEAKIRDYNENWKEKRRNFQLCTRCMTSMIERICFPLKKQKYWKILIECVKEKKYNGCKNMLGVCTIQAEIDYPKFISLSEIDKKKEILHIIMDTIKEISELSAIVTVIQKAILEIEKNNYNNEWYWGKTAKYGNHKLKVKIKHKVNVVEIHMIIYSKDVEILDNVIVTCLPDERVYEKYLGEVGWESQNEAYLISKNGDKYTVMV